MLKKDFRNSFETNTQHTHTHYIGNNFQMFGLSVLFTFYSLLRCESISLLLSLVTNLFFLIKKYIWKWNIIIIIIITRWMNWEWWLNELLLHCIISYSTAIIILFGDTVTIGKPSIFGWHAFAVYFANHLINKMDFFYLKVKILYFDVVYKMNWIKTVNDVKS